MTAASSSTPGRWRWVALVAAAVAFVAIAIAKCDRNASTADADAGVEAPVAAPDGLLCDLYVAAPNASWSKLQRGIGGPVGILPATLPGVVVALLDLEFALTNELDGSSPMYGALAGDPADPAFAVAMRLVDPRRARAAFVGVDGGPYVARELPDAGMTVLTPSGAGMSTERRLATAITNNGFFLVGRRPEDLSRLGPWVTRTLPTRPAPDSAAVVVDVPRAAIAGLIKPKLEALWKDGKEFLLGADARMQKERGRAPDFADPAAIVAALDAAVSRRVGILGDLEHVRLALDVTEDSAVATVTLTPSGGEASEAGRWIRSMKLGDAAPVLALPAESALALSMRDDEPARAEQARAFEDAVTSALGPRLKEPAKLHDVIDAATKARGDVLSLAVSLDDPFGTLLRAPVRDGESASRAIRGAFDLARAEPFKDILRVKGVTSGAEELPGLGKIETLTMSRAPERPRAQVVPTAAAAQDAGAGAAAKPSNDRGVAWIIADGALALGAGAEPLVTLKLGAKPLKKLADEPSLRRFVDAIGTDASTVLVLQPLRLDPKRANLPTAPLAIAVGRKGSDAFVRVDVSDGLLREAARWQMGF